jgi:signal transduction histidine kinase
MLRIVREAVTNAGRHARASVVTVSVDTSDGFALEVHDNGDGFDVTQTPAGFGLNGMRERAEAIGGEFTVSCGPSGGSTVRVVFP